MIYEDRFTKDELTALDTLRVKLSWGESSINYFIAYMILLSNLNPRLLKYKNNQRYGGYLSLNARTIKREIKHKRYTLARLIHGKSSEQILWYKYILTPLKGTLESITDDILGLPKDSPNDTLVFKTQIYTVPRFKNQLHITKQEVMDIIEGIVKDGKMG
jgi:hypothetical protein